MAGVEIKRRFGRSEILLQHRSTLLGSSYQPASFVEKDVPLDTLVNVDPEVARLWLHRLTWAMIVLAVILVLIKEHRKR